MIALFAVVPDNPCLGESISEVYLGVVRKNVFKRLLSRTGFYVFCNGFKLIEHTLIVRIKLKKFGKCEVLWFLYGLGEYLGKLLTLTGSIHRALPDMLLFLVVKPSTRIDQIPAMGR
jgi:hypothetical protein